LFASLWMSCEIWSIYKSIDFELIQKYVILCWNPTWFQLHEIHLTTYCVDSLVCFDSF
jgi:hypothetical protein